MKLTEALELWIQHEKFTDIYAANIRRNFALHLEPIVKGSAVECITNRQLRKAVAIMWEEQLSPYTITTFCQLQRRFFRCLQEAGAIETSPYSKDLNPKAEANKFDTFSNEEEQKILAALPRLPFGDLYLFCYVTGVKGRFARAIHPADVHPETRCLDIRYNVSGSPEAITPLKRPYTLPIRAQDTLPEAACIQSSERTFLFQGKGGSFITKTDVTKSNHMLSLLTGIHNASLDHLAMHTTHKRGQRI